MPLKASYLALVGGGAIVAYSGFKGKGLGSAVRDVITGQNPKNALAANAITGGGMNANTPTNPGALNTTSGGGIFASSAGASEKSFFSGFLHALGAPATKANLESMYTWARQEEPNFPPQSVGGYAWNPLNIKNPATGGFQSWATPTVGAGGTASFMLMNNYSAVVAALRSGQGLIGNTDPNVAAELSAWSGGGYSRIG
jgi:hypothetical protein